jgi:hypothetical protein
MSQETNQETAELTQEQLTAQRKKVVQYYKNQVEVLKVQSEYEGLLAEIEMHRAKRMEMIIRQAQMSAGPQEEQEESEPEQEQPTQPEEPVQSPKERKLKKS